ncbi:MAG TPA: LPS export ABC transporter periplasmic protein LptC [Leptospiraceae bacterium]|nr:LPS export ABC transporter periplasmic protein LptC [Leptospiraceae bacterium]HMW04632.1 LPS export ABC transporter periplasmic protein LptC [Leptospiraceae bacterium]HMX31647.1 LPS export ABC transporter periplasmic protein LptC [Leptospiraceae bacterium]HMY30468.1 LPS export ABC transporter periplasmic protein LptC [Leptospiraceae bacterium]HMZ66647.1 LPS export ABC transporter periplasmic protein LptC [Leptospiraceae bacterium]
MKKTILISIILSILFQCKKKNSLRIENEKESGSTISLRNFTRDAFNEKGELVWILKAEEAFVYVNDGKSIFYGLHFDQYENGKIKSKLIGDRAEIDQKLKQLKVNGNIDLIAEDSRHLKAEELFYDLEKETLNTDKPVTIIMKGTTINGIGMEADKGLNKVKILKPAGVSSDNPLGPKIRDTSD